jgi:hypothetical protein
MHGMTGPLGAQTQQPLARRRDGGQSRAGNTPITGTTDPLPKGSYVTQVGSVGYSLSASPPAGSHLSHGERATQGATEVRLRRHTVEWLSPRT